MRRSRLWMLFAGLMLLSLIALMPMRLFLPESQISARNISGSIWSARLENVSAGGIPLGNLRAGLRWPGRLAFHDGARLSGSAGLIGDGYSLRDLTGKLALSSVNSATQDVEFLSVNIISGKEGCTEASGRIRLRLAQTIATVPMGQLLVGAPRCDGANLVTRLSSQSALEVLTLTALPDGKTRTEILIRRSEPDAASALLAAGFVETLLGYRKRLED
jgi:general secretion pathway protein N